jgi:hypothetical protein
MQICRLAAIAIVTTFVSACAHPIVISPDLDKIEAASVSPRPKTVGLYIPPAEKAIQVTTPVGGGDKIAYFPYRDLEGGLYKVLSNLFEKVVVVSSPTDMEALIRDKVALVVQPQIATQSSSESLLTWPPTFFQVQLSCTFTDAGGTRVSEVLATGVGKATFSEFSSDFPLAAKRASLDALSKIQRAIADDSKLK